MLESYRPDGTLNWRLLGLEFVDMADVDPASDTDVFTKEEHFRMDYSRPRGQEWSYEGYTLGRFQYPEDPRLHIGSGGAWVRRIGGQRILFVTEMGNRHLQVYRFDPPKSGEIAIPSGFIALKHVVPDTGPAWPPHQPPRGEWIWRDRNGNGRFDRGEYETQAGKDAPEVTAWSVDAAGTVWQVTEKAGIRMIPHHGLDPRGNPTWSYANMKVFPKPAQFDRVRRVRYDPNADVMYVGGTTSEHTNQHWKPMGPVICRFDNWSKGISEPTWRIVAPYAHGSNGHTSCEPMGFDIAGDYVFAPYTGASKETGYSTGHIEVFRARDGHSVGFMEPPDDIGEIGLQDITECLRAHRRATGEYVLFLEEDAKAKLLLYRWKP